MTPSKAHLESHVISLINDVYEAAMDPKKWDQFMLRLKELLQADNAMMIHQNLETGESFHISSKGVVDPSYIQLFDAYYGKVNPFIFFDDQTKLQPGHVAIDTDQIPIEVFKKTEFYADFYTQFDLMWGIGTTFARSKDSFDYIVLQASGKKNDFQAVHKHILQVISPHLSRAFAISQLLGQGQFLKDLALKSLDLLNVGLVLINSKKEVFYYNQLAGQFFDQKDGLILKNKQLEALYPMHHQVLDHKISEALVEDQGAFFQSGNVVRINRMTKNAFYNVCICPYTPKVESCLLSSKTVIVFIFDGNRDFQPSHLLLQKHYQLTPTECQVTSGLLKDLKPEDIAGLNHISLHTVRAHIRNIFKKVGVNRQSSLVAKIYIELHQNLLHGIDIRPE